MRRAVIALLALAPTIAACTATTGRKSIVTATAPQPVWAGVATPEDSERIAELSDRFAKVRADVPRNRERMAAGEGALLDPSAAQLAPDLPPGPYHCRLVRFGGRARLATFKPDFCYIETGKGNLSFTKQTGSNLPEGWIYPDSERRQVFLGAARRKGDPGQRRYGESSVHDLAGLVERVAPFRWRLILTRAEGGGELDVYELVPVAPRVPGAAPTVPG